MKLTRLFFYDSYKGTKNYLKTQKRYEIARTVLYFAISIILFVTGWVTTGSRENLLTVVAILGCLPACKSTVDMIMFIRYEGCSEENAGKIEPHCDGLQCCYDFVFTSYDKNYPVAHLAVKGNTICAFTQKEGFDEQAFYKHIDTILKKDNYRDVTVKIFSDIQKYTNRLDQLKELDTDEKNTAGIINTLKSVSL